MVKRQDSSYSKPIVLLTHTRSCSTVIERVFWTNPKIRCLHEHFGDAFYFGPERISDHWKGWPADRIPKSGKAHVTYRPAIEDMLQPGKCTLNKDMAYHIIPSKGVNIKTVPSLRDWGRDSASQVEPDDETLTKEHVHRNPNWLPVSVIDSLQFAFLIRSPWLAVPSLYKLHVPPAVHVTMIPLFTPNEIGYRDLKIMIQYLYPHLRDDDQDAKIVRGGSASTSKDSELRSLAKMPIVIDVSDVLAAPEMVLGDFCSRVGLPFSPSMLSWKPHDLAVAEAFGKFPGFHDDVIASAGFCRKTKAEELAVVYQNQHRPVQGQVNLTDEFGLQEWEDDDQDQLGMRVKEEEYFACWKNKYGEEGAVKILEAVKMCVDDYAWLKKLVVQPR